MSSSGTLPEKDGTLNPIPMNASSTARFDREPQQCAFGAGFRASNLGIEWNAENQLKKVLKNAATIATFAYDPRGRRVEKVVGATTTTFTYTAEDILRETTGGTTTYYVHGPGIDEPLAKEVSGTSTYYHADGLGSILKMTNATGSVTHEYRYGAYGRIEAGSAQGGFSFTGREWDPEFGWYYFRARYYDPTDGRFQGEDPLWLIAGPNLYAYVSNNPVTRVDPLGMEDRSGVNDLISEFLLNSLLEDPISAIIAGLLAEHAENTAEALRPGENQVNDRGDALRHCIWSCTMTETLGADIAESIASTHEVLNMTGRNFSPEESAMDQENNRVGRQCGQSNNGGNCTWKCITAPLQNVP